MAYFVLYYIYSVMDKMRILDYYGFAILSIPERADKKKPH